MPDTQPSTLRLVVDVKDACQILAVSRSGLYALIKSGRLRRIKLGRSARFALADIQRLVDEAL